MYTTIMFQLIIAIKNSSAGESLRLGDRNPESKQAEDVTLASSTNLQFCEFPD
jgi:hypothetical protein